MIKPLYKIGDLVVVAMGNVQRQFIIINAHRFDNKFATWRYNVGDGYALIDEGNIMYKL